MTPIAGAGRWTAGTSCPRCGADVTLSNVATARMPGGFEAMFFASSEEERQEAMALLGALRDGDPEFTTADELAAFVEERAPFLQALADWIRAHQDALIAALVPTIVTVLTTVLMQDDSISPEELEQILERNSPPEIIVIHDDANEPYGGPDDEGERRDSPEGGRGQRHEDNGGQKQGEPPQDEN